jgi:hypothetical protein
MTRIIEANEDSGMLSGMTVIVTEGTVNADSEWELITNDPIVVGTTSLTFIPIAGDFILNKTYAQLSALLAAGTAIPGQMYKITDRGHRGIIVIVDDSGQRTALDAMFLAAVPDYQDVSGDFAGVWYSSIAGLAIGKLVAYGGLMYESLTGNAGTAPSGDAVNWLALDRSTDPLYIEETYACEFDFENDWIGVVRDIRRGNTVGSSKEYSVIYGVGPTYNTFQWGRDGVFNNYAVNAEINNVNFPGVVQNTRLGQASRIFGLSGPPTATVDRVSLGVYCFIYNITFGDNSVVSWINLGCANQIGEKTLGNNISVSGITITATPHSGDINVGWINTETISSSINNRTYSSGFSDFTATLDLDDAAIYSGTTLTIPTTLKHVGVFTLTSAADKSIDTIVKIFLCNLFYW